ncbi:hypothetical protein 101118UKE1_012 [Escherichia phage vB_EcoP-101118UKE1]|uniref:Uncharacterized protein n=1 Tax=Escherichia phage vB_EcoP-101118UKE1 TaxID=2865798 RepID=A0ABX9AFC4_9CAUD|nr:hypothetical protein 101118UKE1_012 [Escherichia phage vB_EcoP-101118UKE1]
MVLDLRSLTYSSWFLRRDDEFWTKSLRPHLTVQEPQVSPIGPLSVQTKGPTPVYHKVRPMVKTSGQR